MRLLVDAGKDFLRLHTASPWPTTGRMLVNIHARKKQYGADLPLVLRASYIRDRNIGNIDGA